MAPNALLLDTVGPNICLCSPPITIFVAECLAIDSYKKLMTPETGPLKVKKNLGRVLMINKQGIINTVLIARALLASLRDTVLRLILYEAKENVKNELMKSTLSNEKLLQNNLLRYCENTQAIVLCFKPEREISFNTSLVCEAIDMATHQPMVCSSPPSISLNSSFFANGTEKKYLDEATRM